jgi:hypothetical protein
LPGRSRPANNRRPKTDFAGFGAVTFDNDGKTVAFADAALEIDDIAHGLDEITGEAGRDAGTAQRPVEIATYGAFDAQRR